MLGEFWSTLKDGIYEAVRTPLLEDDNLNRRDITVNLDNNNITINIKEDRTYLYVNSQSEFGRFIEGFEAVKDKLRLEDNIIINNNYIEDEEDEGEDRGEDENIVEEQSNEENPVIQDEGEPRDKYLSSNRLENGNIYDEDDLILQRNCLIKNGLIEPAYEEVHYINNKNEKSTTFLFQGLEYLYFYYYVNQEKYQEHFKHIIKNIRTYEKKRNEKKKDEKDSE